MLAGLELPVAGHDADLPADRTANDMNATAELAEPASVDAPSPPPAVVVASPAAENAAVPAAQARAQLTLGQRLRQGREERGWSAQDVGVRLHLPVQIIQRLEAEQFERIGHGIYLRGYLINYARLVDVPTILVDAVARQHDQSPTLVTSGTISHSRYLYQRYSVSALYLILTGVIIVPAVMLAMRAGLQPSVAELTALEAPAANSGAEPGLAVASPADRSPTAVAPAGADTSGTAGSANDAPLVASLAPFSALSHKEIPVHGETAAAPVAAAEAHTLKLTLREASWVEVLSASGEKLEYGLLPAGTTRSYRSYTALDVRLGNCSGAEVETDGQLQDLTPFRRSNVARFKLFAAGAAISARSD
jgi:cytoskeleton protein RodZ